MPAASAEKLTKERLDALRRRRPNRQYTIWDREQTGLCVLVSPGPPQRQEATLTFRVVYYLPSHPGQPRYLALGRYPDKYRDLKDVRRLASTIRNQAEEGIDPKRPAVATAFAAVASNFIELYAKKNRTWKETQRLLHTYVLPQWGELDINAIKRSQVSDLLDRIEHKKIKRNGELLGGAVTADATLAAIRKLFNWHATRSDDFRSPIVKGMARAKPPKERARQRVLSDAELRTMWPVLAAMGPYGAAVQCMLLTAQRAHTVGRMRRADILASVRDSKGGPPIAAVWDPVRADDPKNKQDSVVPLSRTAYAIITAVPIIDADNAHDFVFSVNGRAALNGWSKYKARLDRKLGFSEPWQLRDLRRTARTLMGRAGVASEIAERALGHVMTLVRGTYDKYDYLRESRRRSRS